MSAESHPKRAGLTADHVLWAYRLLLDREPESPAVVAEWLRAVTSTFELRRGIMRSTEFAQKHTEILAYSSERRPAIALLEDDLRLFVDLADSEIGIQALRGTFEPVEQAFVRGAVKPGQRVLDVGANIGLFSMLLAHLVGPEGRVHAYEPLPQNLGLFERSIRENGFEKRIELTRAAVGESVGTANLVWLPLEHGALNSGGAFLQGPDAPTPAGHEVASVPVISIDSQNLPGPVSFVKIDVEGAELLAFRGAREMLARDRPTILAEVNPVQLRRVSRCTPSDLLAYMASLGFACRILPHPGVVTSLPESGPLLSVVFSALAA